VTHLTLYPIPPAQHLRELDRALLFDQSRKPLSRRPVEQRHIPLALGDEPLELGAAAADRRRSLTSITSSATVRRALEYRIDERGQLLPVVRQNDFASLCA
jgi:hypothetical protein